MEKGSILKVTAWGFKYKILLHKFTATGLYGQYMTQEEYDKDGAEFGGCEGQFPFENITSIVLQS